MLRHTLVLLFVVCSLIVASYGESIYLSVNSGNNDSNCGTEDEPCSTLEYALHQLPSDTTSGIINIFPGNYEGQHNINVEFPTISILLQNINPGGGEVTFDCGSSTNSTAFLGGTNLSIYGIKITNCNCGVQFTPLRSHQTLTLTHSVISHSNIGILHHGGNLIVETTQISNCSLHAEIPLSGSGIHIQSNSAFATESVAISSSYIENTLSYAIFISSAVPEIEILNTNFLKYGSIFVAGGEDCVGLISDCTMIGFQSIKSLNAIDIVEGTWNMENLTLSGVIGTCETGVFVDGLKSISLSNIANYIGDTGYHITGGSVTFRNGLINNQRYGIRYFPDDEAPIRIEIDNMNIQTELDIFNMDCLNGQAEFYPEVEIKNCVFDHTGRTFIGCPSNGVVSSTVFSNIDNERAFYITANGKWEFNNVTISNENVASHGAIEALTVETSVNEIELSICDSLFVGNEADSGAAIYFHGSALNITNTEFTHNHVTDLGGAILLNGDSFMKNVKFSNNVAGIDGAAIYCLSSSRIMFLDDDSIIFEDNESEGNDVTCTVVSSSAVSWVWVYAGILGTFCIVIIIIGVIYLLKRKRFPQQTRAEFQELSTDNDDDEIELEQIDPDTLSDEEI